MSFTNNNLQCSIITLTEPQCGIFVQWGLSICIKAKDLNTFSTTAFVGIHSLWAFILKDRVSISGLMSAP